MVFHVPLKVLSALVLRTGANERESESCKCFLRVGDREMENGHSGGLFYAGGMRRRLLWSDGEMCA